MKWTRSTLDQVLEGPVGPSPLAGAELSADRVYRYALARRWSVGPYALFICLNPSTADEQLDDPTVRRCIGFAKSWGGYGAVCIANLFAYRATDPREMKVAVDPEGEENMAWLDALSERAGITVAAWGAHGGFMDQGKRVASRLRNPHALALTKDGQPRHPLYLKKTLTPFEWPETAR